MAYKKKLEDLKILIIDDEPHCLEVIELMLGQMDVEFKETLTCLGSTAGFQRLKSYEPDLVFLDIQMPVMNGFDLLEKLDQINFGIIFTTAHDEYAIKAFKTSAIDYLLKPIKQSEMEQAIIRYINGYNSINDSHANFLLNQLKETKHSTVSRIALPTLDGITFFFLQNINFFEANDTISYIHLQNGNRIAIKLRFKEVEEKLEGLPFYRLHKSYIINMDKIRKIITRDGIQVEMDNGEKVSVSRRKKHEFLSLINAR